MRSPLRLLPAALLILSLGCQSHRIANARPDPERLSQEEMLREHFTNVYDAVASLRSAWLTIRGTDSFQQPSQVWVYYDETRLGGVDEMRSELTRTERIPSRRRGRDAFRPRQFGGVAQALQRGGRDYALGGGPQRRRDPDLVPQVVVSAAPAPPRTSAVIPGSASRPIAERQ